MSCKRYGCLNVPNDEKAEFCGEPCELRWFRENYPASEAKWRNYEDAYIIPCFDLAQEAGIDLNVLLSESRQNCVITLINALIGRGEPAQAMETSRVIHERDAAVKEATAMGFGLRLIASEGDFNSIKRIVASCLKNTPKRIKAVSDILELLSNEGKAGGLRFSHDGGFYEVNRGWMDRILMAMNQLEGKEGG